MKSQELSDLRHNINNPLAIINCNAKIVQRRTADQDIMNAMDTITQAANRISAYLRSLMDDKKITYTVLKINDDDSVQEIFKCRNIDSLVKYVKKFIVNANNIYIDRSYSETIISLEDFLK